MSLADSERAVSIAEQMIAGDDLWPQSARAQLAALLMSEGITPLRAPGREVLTAGHVKPRRKGEAWNH
jgi:hypothetical protein